MLVGGLDHHGAPWAARAQDPTSLFEFGCLRPVVPVLVIARRQSTRAPYIVLGMSRFTVHTVMR